MTKGWKEWADRWVGIQNSCSRGCVYCFATYLDLRYKRIHSPEQRLNFQQRKSILNPDKKYDGRIAFPNTHDITESNYQKCRNYLDRLLKAGNNVLIVTKPDFNVIEQLISDLENYRKQLEFRITIGSRHSDVLKQFEPGASDFRERLESLSLLSDYSFETSVSIEPFLSRDVATLIEEIYWAVSRDIWVGKMNHFNNIVKYRPEIKTLQQLYTDETLIAIYHELQQLQKRIPYVRGKIKFKDTFLDVLKKHGLK